VPVTFPFLRFELGGSGASHFPLPWTGTLYSPDGKHQFQVIRHFDLMEDPVEHQNLYPGDPFEMKKLSPLMSRYRKLLQQRLDEMPFKKGPLDQEAKEQLESLGYL
jgi:hypothetical protein